MNITPIDTAKNETAINRALDVLVDAGISFEVVDRCPVECAFCDEALSHAA
ncbi:MAG: hypothetical protein HKN91_18205 [Acidimicrobiia bacterium]|nr:hypothetical protein [Acidimicrobiia bacterium]